MKSKLIAVQEGLHETAELLKKQGYRVTTIDQANEPIDVIIYSSKNKEYLAHNMRGNISIPSYNQFVKMINVDEVGINNIINNVEELE
ncbi:Uncharacterised protein family (UPF0180) [Natronincola peptidivorans]|uniref:Uncharacterized protein family (UPF0180) n=1 Tax=Natronincola peptidivorans TaxID=426128 RepID=A0A1H9Y7I6_9FIRM|nr:YkuS family protein [Natronincola peptidivorans]SES64324.1 Uncharacterised protein family (UPF0180) [Natronincola peptidivorans]